jgi:4-amino-4-deoxy-L-arabinose transferase-like glycosyltransferase
LVWALLPFLAFLLLVYGGIDFGAHWDENYNKIDSVAYSLRNGFTLLPEQYSYPGVNYWLTFSALTSELLHAIVDGKCNPEALKNTLLPVLNGQVFRLRLRRIFAFITALTALWIYFAVLIWGRSWLEAMCAAMFFAFSWEMVYHARWIAPDGILMQFGALTFLLLSIAWRTGSRKALYFAAVAAGFGCGSKYPGALLLLPILAVIWLVGHSWRRAVRDSALVLAIFATSYLITTPGTILQPFAFYSSVSYQRHVYATGWFGYSVRPGLRHLSRILIYFATQLGSTYKPVAILLSAFCLVGIWALIKESWRSALIVLLFPVVYLLYFSTQSAMIVRNYLVVAPFLFILMARGVVWTSSKLPWPKARVGFAAAIVLIIAVNAIDQTKAAATVRHRRNVPVFMHAFERYTQAHPDWTFLISPRLARELKAQQFWGTNLVAQNDTKFDQPYQVYASYYSESVVPYQFEYQTNRPGSFVAVFGPREVNLDYYTGWSGDDRIVCLSPAEVQTNILPNLRIKRLHWTGEVSFDGVAEGAREPLIVTGEPTAGDFLYGLRIDPQTVRVYWNHYGVGDTAGITLHTEKGQRHSLAVDIDLEGGKADAQIDGAPALSYRGPIFPSSATRVEIGKNTVGLGYISASLGGSIQEVSRKVDE